MLLGTSVGAVLALNECSCSSSALLEEIVAAVMGTAVLINIFSV